MITVPAQTGGAEMHRFGSSHLGTFAEMVRFRLQFVETGLNVDFHLVKIKPFFRFRLALWGNWFGLDFDFCQSVRFRLVS